MGFGKAFKKAVKSVSKAVSKAAKQAERAVAEPSQKILGDKGYALAKGVAKGVTFSYAPGLYGAKLVRDTANGENPIKNIGNDVKNYMRNITLSNDDDGDPKPPAYEDTPEGLDFFQSDLRWKRRRRSKAMTHNDADGELNNTLGKSATLGV